MSNTKFLTMLEFEQMVCSPPQTPGAGQMMAMRGYNAFHQNQLQHVHGLTKQVTNTSMLTIVSLFGCLPKGADNS